MSEGLKFLKTLGGFGVVLLPLALGGGCGGVGATPDAKLGDMPSKGPVGRTIRGSSEKFLACARDSVTVQTESIQEMKLKFTVEADGSVKRAAVIDMSAPDPDLQACVLKTLRKLNFPKPSDGKPKEIKYPLVLKPDA